VSPSCASVCCVSNCPNCLPIARRPPAPPESGFPRRRRRSQRSRGIADSLQDHIVTSTSILRLFGCALGAFWSLGAWSAATTTGESNEIQFTSAAAADLTLKAASLGSSVAIYEYVRNNYDFSLYHGARSGSINTFQGGRGNDVDLAATLIAMLRSRGIP